MTSAEEKKELHRAFLERRNAEPLIGAIRGWENLSRYVQDTEVFFPKGDVKPDEVFPDRFAELFEGVLPGLISDDALFRTLEPLPFFPWAEAAMGCRIEYTGKNFWSQPVSDWEPSKINPRWIEIYGEILSYLAENYPEIPIGQPVLRGPLDLAAAVYGDEQMIYRFFDHPEDIRDFLDRAADIFLQFIDMQQKLVPEHAGGRVIGSYYIWTPSSCMRHQEDAMALLSPDIYDNFGDPVDRRIASRVDYTLMHVHATGLHLVDTLLKNERLTIIQVSKDTGVALDAIFEKLIRIQRAGVCLLVKGRFTAEEVHKMKAGLDSRGLCIQGVVLSDKEVNTFYEAFI